MMKADCRIAFRNLSSMLSTCITHASDIYSQRLSLTDTLERKYSNASPHPAVPRVFYDMTKKWSENKISLTFLWQPLGISRKARMARHKFQAIYKLDDLGLRTIDAITSHPQGLTRTITISDVKIEPKAPHEELATPIPRGPRWTHASDYGDRRDDLAQSLWDSGSVVHIFLLC